MPSIVRLVTVSELEVDFVSVLPAIHVLKNIQGVLRSGGEEPTDILACLLKAGPTMPITDKTPDDMEAVVVMFGYRRVAWSGIKGVPPGMGGFDKLKSLGTETTKV